MHNDERDDEVYKVIVIGHSAGCALRESVALPCSIARARKFHLCLNDEERISVWRDDVHRAKVRPSFMRKWQSRSMRRAVGCVKRDYEVAVGTLLMVRR